ncbi:hypothetical protein GWA97_14050, partial [Flavobacterium sp. LaA7.5]|nr:hypothetical protein [Flavobacterium salilacus subsp. altitudinum]
MLLIDVVTVVEDTTEVEVVVEVVATVEDRDRMMKKVKVEKRRKKEREKNENIVQPDVVHSIVDSEEVTEVDMETV